MTENSEATALLSNGEADIAAVATNVASNFYHKTDGSIQMLAVNTMGVLYILEKGDSIQSMADLRGKTIYATGQGANPEYILNYLLTQNGLDPAADVTIQWLTAQDGRQVFVTYSLGNFISAQSSSDNMIGAILSVEFEKTTQPDGSSTTVVQNPQLIPTVTQYENGYSDIRVYLYRDYTDELGAAHGNFTLSRDYIQQVLQESIDPRFWFWSKRVPARTTERN